MARPLLLLGLLAASAPVFAQEANFNLRPELKKPYRFQLKTASAGMETPQGTFSLKVEIAVSTTFTEITPEKLTSKNKMESLDVYLNDNRMDIPGGVPQTEATVVQKPDGTVISRDVAAGAMQQSPRYQAMMDLSIGPGKLVKVGESWTRDIPADQKKGLVASRAKFTFEKQEMVGGVLANVVNVAYSELEGARPMGMVGKVWVEASTGILLKMTASMTAVSMNQAMPPMDMSMEMVRIP